ncbi:phosphoribosylglycinamide formyltransferase [Eubacterium minutum ATCC 700079]|nr:phosphoribosylglycinamide formyltransferase [Eubacterium minutum ATCC 700079]
MTAGEIKICVMVSGGGTNLQALIDAEKSGIIHSGKISLVVSDNPDAYGLVRAEKSGIATFVSKDERDLVAKLKENHIDMIVLAGYLKILSPDVTSLYRNRIINVHPSLIPSFCGKGCYGLRVHRKALEYGVKVTGATVHFVNEIPDGGKIIAQKAVEIMDDDTPQTLQKRVMQEAEWILLPRATEKLAAELKGGIAL